MEKYNLNQIAMMTGLTTRTLRTYLNMGLLSGKKENNTWTFTEENIENFFNDPNVKQALKAKRNAVVYDFLADTNKKDNRVCIIMDFKETFLKQEKIMMKFIDIINNIGSDIEFKANNEKNLLRIILSGDEINVRNIINEYYKK